MNSTRIRRSALIVGVANQRSLAWSSALSLLYQGQFDHVVVTYQNERFQSAVDRLIQEQNRRLERKTLGSYNVPQAISEWSQQQRQRISSLQCDVSTDEDVRLLCTDKLPSLLREYSKEVDQVAEPNGALRIDALIHSIAFAPTEAMKSDMSSLPLLHTSRDAFATSHWISSYSLLSLTKYALPLLSCQEDKDTENGRSRHPSVTALTYLGATRAVPNYNIMGSAKASLESLIRGLALELGPKPHCIRVNGVSAGPVNTLAARGIKDFVEMKSEAAQRSCLKRNVTSEEVGNLVAFLADGTRSSGVTGQIIFCDAGFSSCSL